MLRRMQKLRDIKGYSLVEIVVVMAILSVVMMAVMSLYIPAVRSTSVQTELSDVQSNLRLALDRMTKDLMLAGFLVNPGYSYDLASDSNMAPGGIYWQSGTPEDDDDLTIRTRTVGNAFARIVDSDTNGNLGLSDPDMLDAFPVGTNVRIFASVSAVEAESINSASYNETSSTYPDYFDDYVYTVVASAGSPPFANNLKVTPAPSGELNQAVVVKVRDNNQPPMQTIRYRVNNGALERIINGSTQILARNVASVAFDYEYSSMGAVKRVDITLTAEPVGLAGGGAESAPKNRQLQTSVALRNVY